MGKVVQIIAGIGLVVGAGIILIASGGAAWQLSAAIALQGGSLIYNAVQGARPLAEQQGAVLENRTGAKLGIPVIYGTTRVGPVLADVRVDAASQNRKRLVVVCAFSHGSSNGTGVEEITEIFLDDQLAWTQAGGVQAPFNTAIDDSGDPIQTVHLKVNTHFGTTSDPVDANLTSLFPTEWPSTSQGKSVCYVVLFMWFNNDVFASNLPRINAVIKGNRLADPRSGASTVFSTNPALAIRDYLTSSIYGFGEAVADVDDASFEVAADFCDELVTPISGGSTQKRFEVGGWIDTKRPIRTNLADLATSCRATMINIGGVWKIIIRKQQSVSGLKLTTGNTVEGSWHYLVPGSGEVPNSVVVNYIDPGRNYQVDSVQWPEPGQTNPHLIDDSNFINQMNMDLPFTDNRLRAQQIGMTVLREMREGIAVTVTAKEDMLQAEVGDIVEITQPSPAWVDKPFWVVATNYQPMLGVVDLILIEFEPTVYDIENQFAQPTIPNTGLPDPFTVAAPTGLVLTAGDTESIVTADGVRVVRIKMDWTAPVEAFLDHYEVEAKKNTEADFDSYGTVPKEAVTFLVSPATSELWDVRVRAVNTLGVHSAYLTGSITPSVTGSIMSSESIEVADSPLARYRLRETDQTLPLGLWGLTLDGDQLRIQKNTAVAGDFSTFNEFFTMAADGVLTLPERVLLTNADDVDLAGVSGALIIGGDGTGAHLALDGNEIMAKASATAVATLNIQLEGGAVNFGTTPNGLFFDPGVSFRPKTSGALTFGTSSLRWGAGWFQEAVTIGTNKSVELTAPASGTSQVSINWFTDTTTKWHFVARNSLNATVAERNDLILFYFDGSGFEKYLTFSDVDNLIIFDTARAVSMGALTATTGTFSGDVLLSEASPRLMFEETDAAADNQKWLFGPIAEQFRFQILNDAESVSANVFLVDRTGTVVDTIAFPNGNVLIGTTTPATGSPKLDIVGDAFMLGGADSTTNAVNKNFAIAARHFTNSEQSLAMIHGFTTVGTNRVFIGGGFGALNAATGIEFYTAANTTTLAGTLAADITGVGTASLFHTRGDLKIASLGTFDSASVPDLDDVLRFNGTKWIPAGLQFRFTDGDVVAQAFSDGTASAFVDDGRAIDDVPPPVAPSAAPILTAGYKTIVVDMSAHTLPADKKLVVQWSIDAGVTWSNDATVDEIVTTGGKVVHTKLLIDGTTYRYRFRERGATTSTPSPETADLAPLSTPDINVATIILASQISTVDLSSISANIGVVTAGIVRDTNSKFEIDLANRLLTIIDEQGTPRTRIKIGEVGGGLGDWGIQISDDAGNVILNAQGSVFQLQESAVTPVKGINLKGTLPGAWTTYIDFTATGSAAFIQHPALTLEADGDADFSGTISSSAFITGDAIFGASALVRHIRVAGGTGRFTFHDGNGNAEWRFQHDNLDDTKMKFGTVSIPGTLTFNGCDVVVPDGSIGIDNITPQTTDGLHIGPATLFDFGKRLRVRDDPSSASGTEMTARFDTIRTAVSTSLQIGISQTIDMGNTTGTIATAIGIQSRVNKQGNGTLTKGIGIEAIALVTAGSGIMTDLIALNCVARDDATAAVTNIIGLNVQDVTGGTNNFAIKTGLGKCQFGDEIEIDGDFNHDGTRYGFTGSAPQVKPSIGGSRGGNAALAQFLTAMALVGLITDNTTA